MKVYLIILLILSINLASALSVNIPTGVNAGNYSTINVNDSSYWQGYTPQTYNATFINIFSKWFYNQTLPAQSYCDKNLSYYWRDGDEDETGSFYTTGTVTADGGDYSTNYGNDYGTQYGEVSCLSVDTSVLYADDIDTSVLYADDIYSGTTQNTFHQQVIIKGTAAPLINIFKYSNDGTAGAVGLSTAKGT